MTTTRSALSAVAALGLAALLTSCVIPRQAASDAPAPAPTVTVTTTPPPSAQLVPVICLQALDDADALNLVVVDVFNAIGNTDVAAMNDLIGPMRRAREKWEASSAACRAESW